MPVQESEKVGDLKNLYSDICEHLIDMMNYLKIKKDVFKFGKYAYVAGAVLTYIYSRGNIPVVFLTAGIYIHIVKQRLVNDYAKLLRLLNTEHELSRELNMDPVNMPHILTNLTCVCNDVFSMAHAIDHDFKMLDFLLAEMQDRRWKLITDHL